MMTTDQEIEVALMALPSGLTEVEEVLLAVDAELSRQDELWGDQSHLPMGTSTDYKALADQARDIAEHHNKLGVLSFADILREEFFEALAEEDPDALEVELVQVAAVAVQQVLALRAQRARRADAES